MAIGEDGEVCREVIIVGEVEIEVVVGEVVGGGEEEEGVRDLSWGCDGIEGWHEHSKSWTLAMCGLGPQGAMLRVCSTIFADWKVDEEVVREDHALVDTKTAANSIVCLRASFGAHKINQISTISVS